MNNEWCLANYQLFNSKVSYLSYSGIRIIIVDSQYCAFLYHVYFQLIEECNSFISNKWVGHAVVVERRLLESEEICFVFEVKHCHSEPPQELFTEERDSAGKCTVEFLTKALPDR